MATFGLESLHKFHISDKYGFILEDPLEILPEYFQPWNDLAKHAPSLAANKEIRKKVHQLQLLDHTKLQGHREYRLAHLQLCVIASGYVWQDGDKGVTQVLPECVAVPWFAVTEKLGIKPILSYPSFILANWKLKNPNKPIEVENLQCLYELPPGGPEVEWFVVVSAQVEFDFASGIENIIEALQHAENGETEELRKSLDQITSTVLKMKSSLQRMHDKLSGDTFYNKMRTYLQGWGGKSSPLPDGLVFEGVSKQPIQAIGGSAAQSSTVQTFDAVLGIKHEADKGEFLQKMRDYMLPAHKNFIEMVAQQSKIRQLVQKGKCEELTNAYNKCVSAVTDFRSYHIQIVAKYIVIMSNKALRNKSFEAVPKVGTGGSSAIPFLKCLRDSTKDSLIRATEVKSPDTPVARKMEHGCGDVNEVSLN